MKKTKLAGLLLSIQIITGIFFSWMFYSCINIYPMISIESLLLRTKFVIPKIDMERLSKTSDIYSSLPVTSSFASKVFKIQKSFIDNVFKMKRIFYTKRGHFDGSKAIIFFYNDRMKSIIINLKELMDRINHSGSKEKVINEFDMFQKEWGYLLDSAILYRKTLFRLYSIFQIILSLVVLSLLYDFQENKSNHFYLLIFLSIIFTFIGTTELFLKLDYYQLSRDIFKNHRLIHNKIESSNYESIRSAGDIGKFFQSSEGDSFDFFYTLESISGLYFVRYQEEGKENFLFFNKKIRNNISIITDNFYLLLSLDKKEDALKAMRKISKSISIFLVDISSFHKEVFLMTLSFQFVLLLFLVVLIFIHKKNRTRK